MTQWVYNFGKTGTDGDASRRNLLGGKGANLAEMSGIGLPVPPGFTLSTVEHACADHYVLLQGYESAQPAHLLPASY